jgi:DNA-binding CsgD family transcriptional regulator/tetratricopeptide (TPR) repeat protein
MASGSRDLALDIRDALCETLSSAGKVDLALKVGGELVTQLQPPTGPIERLVHVHVRLARTAASACHWDVAEGHLARVSALADPDESLTAHTQAISAHIFFGRGDPKRATEAALSALAAAERAGLHDVACEALEVVGRAARLSDLDRAETAFVRAHDIAVDHGLTFWRVRALFELGTLDLLALRDVDRLLAARESALAIGALAVAAHVDLHIAAWYALRLDSNQVIEASRRCADAARRFGMQQLLAISLVFEADGWARLGREEEMEAQLQKAFALRGDDPEVCAMAWAHVRARSSIIAENRRRAVQELETAMTYFRRLSTAPPVVGRAYWALLRALEDRDGEAASAEVRASGVTANVLSRGYVHLTDAVLLGRAGQTAQAEEAFSSGDELLAAVPWHRQFGRRLVADAAIADGWGDTTAWMLEALPVFEDHGHDEIAAACRSLLRRAGAPVPRRGNASSIPTGLRSLGVTAREAEVLTLLSEGLPNREIAERLYLSPRTVERHIANLTVKAGVRGRSELIAFAARAT